MSTTVTRTATSIDSAGTHTYVRRLKNYDFETRKGLFVALETTNLAITAAKSLVLVLIGEKPVVAHEVPRKFIQNAAKDMAIITTKVLLQRAAEKTLHARTASKLMKDISKSATRKFVRTGSKSAAAVGIVRTGLRSQVLTHISIFLVEVAVDGAFVYAKRSNRQGMRNKKLISDFEGRSDDRVELEDFKRR
eukprot:Opistho-2@19809